MLQLDVFFEVWYIINNTRSRKVNYEYFKTYSRAAAKFSKKKNPHIFAH